MKINRETLIGSPNHQFQRKAHTGCRNRTVLGDFTSLAFFGGDFSNNLVEETPMRPTPLFSLSLLSISVKCPLFFYCFLSFVYATMLLCVFISEIWSFLDRCDIFPMKVWMCSGMCATIIVEVCEYWGELWVSSEYLWRKFMCCILYCIVMVSPSVKMKNRASYVC